MSKKLHHRESTLLSYRGRSLQAIREFGVVESVDIAPDTYRTEPVFRPSWATRDRCDLT